jgi:hypothetical protein
MEISSAALSRLRDIAAGDSGTVLTAQQEELLLATRAATPTRPKDPSTDFDAASLLAAVRRLAVAQTDVAASRLEGMPETFHVLLPLSCLA